MNLFLSYRERGMNPRGLRNNLPHGAIPSCTRFFLFMAKSGGRGGGEEGEEGEEREKRGNSRI